MCDKLAFVKYWGYAKGFLFKKVINIDQSIFGLKVGNVYETFTCMRVMIFFHIISEVR